MAFAVGLAAVAATVTAVIAAPARPDPPPADREWRHADGRTITAALMGVERGAAVLRLAGHQRAKVKLTELSEADREWIDHWASDRKPEDVLPPVNWPRTVTHPLPRIDGPVQEGSDFIFRTTHYQFIGDAELSVAAVQDFATVAEATWSLLQTWPLPAPDTGSTPLTARIYRDRDAYHRAGGPPDSAGVFTGRFGRRGALLVPFESLGIESFHGRFTKGAGYRPRVLVHEMTHQIYAPVIRYLPLWLNEGLAEYVALIPYHNGTFRLDRDSMRHALAQRFQDYKRLDPGAHGPFASSETAPEKWTIPLEDLFALDRHDPELRSATIVAKHRAYFTALATVFYFLQCDGDGGARRLRKCFDDLDGFIESRGRANAGSRPPAWSREDVFNGRIREKITEQLLDGRAPKALESELEIRLERLGIKVSFP